MERETPTVPETSTQIDVKLAAIGVVSGIVAAMAMDAFSSCLRSLNGNGREAAGATPGAARHAKGTQPAQANESGDDDATVKVGTAAFEAVTGETPSRETQQWLGTFAHYGFAAAMGVNYLLASEQAPDMRRGYGTVYGSLVWAAADEGVLPAAGLSKKPESDSARGPCLRTRRALGVTARRSRPAGALPRPSSLPGSSRTTWTRRGPRQSSRDRQPWPARPREARRRRSEPFRRRSILRRLAARGHLDQSRIEAGQRLDEIALRRHHLVDVLVGHRHFVQPGGDQRHAALAQETAAPPPR